MISVYLRVNQAYAGGLATLPVLLTRGFRPCRPYTPVRRDAPFGSGTPVGGVRVAEPTLPTFPRIIGHHGPD